MQAIVSFTSWIQFSTPGLWSLQVLTTASSRSTWVWLSGKQVPMNPVSQIGVFITDAAGN